MVLLYKLLFSDVGQSQSFMKMVADKHGRAIGFRASPSSLKSTVIRLDRQYENFWTKNGTFRSAI